MVAGTTDAEHVNAPTLQDPYAAAGVSIEAGAEAVRRMQPLLARTARREQVAMPGGFAGGFALPAGDWRQPVLVSGTDGVGTKLLVAAALGRWDTIGIDAVAMCVNDIAVTGAEPLFFLDYLAMGRADPDVVTDVVSGVAEGCTRAGCALLGGETAEMPGMYAPGHADVAGFAVGIVERDMVPDPQRMQAGDVLVGIASSGLHANGYSLVRRVLLGDLEGDALVERLGLAPVAIGRTLGDELLEPTRIYARLTQALVRRYDVRAFAHITGGGFYENVGRVLPANLDAVVRAGSWPVPAIFSHVQSEGALDAHTMCRVFNMGIGMVAIVPPGQAAAVVAAADAAGYESWNVGEVVAGRSEVRVVDPSGDRLWPAGGVA